GSATMERDEVPDFLECLPIVDRLSNFCPNFLHFPLRVALVDPSSSGQFNLRLIGCDLRLCRSVHPASYLHFALLAVEWEIVEIQSTPRIVHRRIRRVDCAIGVHLHQSVVFGDDLGLLETIDHSNVRSPECRLLQKQSLRVEIVSRGGPLDYRIVPRQSNVRSETDA
ncbi:hypothetical protein PMAYCL1PPCAC_26943, partial [Pristionchus mayeri]